MSDGRATSNHAAKRTIGVGSPGIFKLELFGRVLMDAFGFNAYLVGSNVLGKGGRDVDVVVMLPDDAFDEMFPDRDKPDRWNLRWAAYCHAFSALGAEMTGLPVDFKVQRISDANEKHGGPREPLVAHVPRESEREDEWDGRCVSCGREMSRELPGPRACSRECATQAQAEHATPAAQVCEILVAPDRLDGGFTASFTWPKPMTGCVSQGDSIPETLRNLADAAEGVMAVIAVDAERQS